MCQNFEIDLCESLRFKIQMHGPFLCTALTYTYRMDVYSYRAPGTFAKENLKHYGKHPSKRFNTLKGREKT